MKRTPTEMLTRIQQTAVLTAAGYSVDQIAAELGVDLRTVRRYRDYARTGQTMEQEAERRRIERAVMSGLTSGDTVTAIAASLGVPLTILNYRIDQMKLRYGARTHAHLIAIILGAMPCPGCGQRR